MNNQGEIDEIHHHLVNTGFFLSVSNNIQFFSLKKYVYITNCNNIINTDTLNNLLQNSAEERNVLLREVLS